MKYHCDLIKDLLPLYAEDMVSPYTASLVEEHLTHCPDCQKEFSLLKKPMAVTTPKTTAPLEKIKKMLLLKKLQAIVLTAALVAAAALAVFSYLTTPLYFPYSEDLLTVTTAEDTVTVSFDESVTGCSYESVKGSDNATTYFLSAWTTRLDRILGTYGTREIVLEKEDRIPLSIYFSQNDASSESDIPIYGGTSGVVTLPRLALSYYLQLAGIAFLILAVALLIFWKKKSVRLWLLRGLLLPVSYILGHLCVKGLSTVSYHMPRDLIFIVGVALFLYLALLFGLDLLRRK